MGEGESNWGNSLTGERHIVRVCVYVCMCLFVCPQRGMHLISPGTEAFKYLC